MGTNDWRSQLRGAVNRGDGPAVVALLATSRLADDCLQLIGDGLLAALAQRVDHATEVAVDCAKQLRERGWPGDDDLADQLEARLGTGATPLLKPLRVDLDELAGILEGDPLYGGGRIDLQTGEVWAQPAIEYAVEVGEENEDESQDPERWLWVDCEGSGRAYRDMEAQPASAGSASTSCGPACADRRPGWPAPHDHDIRAATAATKALAVGSGPSPKLR